MVVAPELLELILTDYRLPGNKTGLDVVAELRRMSGRQIPALLLTGDTQTAIVAEATAAGCSILHKPCSPVTVLAVAARLILAFRELPDTSRSREPSHGSIHD